MSIFHKFFYPMFFYISLYLCETCYVNVSHFGKQDSPLLLSKVNMVLNMFKPTYSHSGVIYINMTNQEDMMLACPGEGNKFENFRKNNLLNAVCWQRWPNEESFFIEYSYHGLESLSCLNELLVYEKPTKKKCFDNGEIYEIGFYVDPIMFVLYKVCFNHKHGYTQYAEHTIQGFESFPERTKPLYKRFTLTDLQLAKTIIHMRYFFSQDVQLKKLGPQLGPELTDVYLKGSNFIIGITLVPHADFFVMSHQIATHSLVNVQNMWKPRYNAWRSIEISIRHLAQSDTQYKITTGVYEMAKINGKNIFLGPRQTLPIFSYFWKYIFHEGTKACMMIMMKNIIIDEVNPGCTTSCQENGWLRRVKEEYKKTILCCSPSEINKIPNLPFNYSGCIDILRKK